MNIGLVIGYIAAFLTSIASIPQVIKSIKTKSTKDISMLTMIFTLMLFLLWTTYGVYLNDLPLILGDGIPAIFILTIIGLKLKYG